MIIKGFVWFLYSIQFLVWNIKAAEGRDGQTYVPVHIGVVLNLNSTMGAMADVCISMALEDFYYEHSDYTTRLVLHTKDAQNELDVVSQVLELRRNEGVHGILCAQTLTEGAFVAELGRKAQVPLISFTSTSQSLSHAKNPYFIRTTPDNSNEVKALATICKGFEWHEVAILHEDTNYSYQFTSELYREFLVWDIQFAHRIAIPASATDHHINKELENLMTTPTRAFIVHMDAELGGRLFVLAKKAGMMSEGYGWLVTDTLGNFLNSVDSTALDSMEGVLGIRHHVPKSEKLESFKERWKKNMILSKSANTRTELNVYGLRAYDAIWALATAAEKIRSANNSFSKMNNEENGSDIADLTLSLFSAKLLDELYNTSFLGLSGDFQLIDGQLKSSNLEIFNVILTRDRIIGYWTPSGGVTRKLAPACNRTYTTSTKELKTIFWPGGSLKKPKGWALPSILKVKVMIPNKTGFTEFVNVTRDPLTMQIHPTGFCIDVFESALQLLPFKVDPEFLAVDGAYDDHLHCLSNETCDMVVGDTTILADRAQYVDFSLPYSESGVVWVVRNKPERRSMWIFIKPFTWDLWMTIVATCIFIGVVIRILEHRSNRSSDSSEPHRKQIDMLFWFPIAALAFPERKIVASSWSRFVLVVWLFTVLVVTQSYTAKLLTMLTVDKLDFTFSQDYYIGYQKGSFVRTFLIKHLNISETKLREYSSIEQYDDAMSKGGKNGGIDVIVDEIPYMKLLLNRYGSKYTMLGQRYKTEGLGFAFPKDSTLVVHFSRAILAITESPNMSRIEEMNFGPGYSSEDELDSTNEERSLAFSSFFGLFSITVLATILALFFSVTSVGSKLIYLAAVYSCRCFSFLQHIVKYSRGNSMVCTADQNDSYSEPGFLTPERIILNDSVTSIPPDIDDQSGERSDKSKQS